MKAIQYTIRNIPAPVDRYLRKRSKQSGKSLNQVIIDELSDKVASPNQSLLESLDWFIGGGMDDDVLEALAEDDRTQKQLAMEELERDTRYKRV